MKEGEIMNAIRTDHGPHDYAGHAEVAEYLGISKQCLTNWRNRYPDFPEPVATLKMGPIWRLHEIQAWHRATNPEVAD